MILGNEILPFDVAPGYCAKEMAGSISTATCKTRDDCNDLEDCVEIGQQPLRMCVSMTADSTDGDGKRGKKGKYGSVYEESQKWFCLYFMLFCFYVHDCL